jgi:Dolichyl-phosphate-mannose-protein mannosyltransferase
VLGTAAVAVAHALPGVLGILTRGTALATALLLLAAALFAVPQARRLRPSEPPPPRPARSGLLSWLIGGGSAAAVGLWLLATAWNRTVLPPEGVDTLTFHLPNVARWIQSGTFWQVDQFVPFLANGNYPHNGDVVFLAVLLPWRNDAFIALVNPLYVALAGVAVYALARELGAARSTGALTGALFAALPVVALGTNGQAMTDSMAFALLGAGAVFLLRHERSAHTSDLVLAGVALGLAFGTKWYAVWAVGAVALVWVGARLAGRRDLRRTARAAGAVLGLVLLAGGLWLVRNWVESGNPVFPQRVSALGATIFHAPRDLIRECAGYTIADYLTDGRAWRHFIWPAYRGNYALPGAVLGLGLVGAAAAAAAGLGRRRSRPRPGARSERLALAGIVCAVLLAAAYAVTPYSAFGPEGHPSLTGANARYLAPALLVCAPLAAWAAARAGRLRLLLELAAAVAVIDGLRRGFTVPFGVVAAVAALALAGAALLWYVRCYAGPVAAIAVAALGLGALGYMRQREFNEGRYQSGDPVTAWVARNAPAGHRIALAGSWRVAARSPVWPSFGPLMGNAVAYLGPTVRHQLREYPSRRRWAAALRRGGYDLLIVGRGGYARSCPLPGQSSDDDRWAREEGLRRVTGDDRLTLYRVP